MLIKLRNAGLRAEEEKTITVFDDGLSVGDFVADILVERKVIVEFKVAEALSKAHEVQTVNFFTATGVDIGLLLNFGSERLQI